MAHNIFENTTKENKNVLSHSMQEEIIGLAKQKSVGSLKEAIALYEAEHSDTLAHSVFSDESIGTLFPEYELVKKGAPDTLERDQSWITKVMAKINKSYFQGSYQKCRCTYFRTACERLSEER